MHKFHRIDPDKNQMTKVFLKKGKKVEIIYIFLPNFFISLLPFFLFFPKMILLKNMERQPVSVF